jgi:hypothetical protein
VRNNKPGFTKALLKTAEDMRRVGILDAAVHEKITLRHLGGGAEIAAKPISRQRNSFTAGAGAFKPSGLCPLPQPDDRLCLQLERVKTKTKWRLRRGKDKKPLFVCCKYSFHQSPVHIVRNCLPKNRLAVVILLTIC